MTRALQSERRFPVAPGLLLACAAYVGLRAVLLLFRFDEVSIPIFELPGVGMIPKIALEGWKGSSPRMYYDNCGGLISTGFLAVPFYAALGPTYLALKLVPATLGLAALVLLWRYLNAHWSRAAANVGALVFALLPPTLTRFSLIAQGNHFENLVFQLLVLTAFAAAQQRPASRARVFVFGLASGFAIFTYFGSLAIVALTAGLHLLVRGPRRTLADALLYAPGFLLGIAPLVWVALADGSPQAAIADLLVATKERRFSPLEQLRTFLVERLPRAGVFHGLGPIPRAVPEALFLAAFFASWLALLPAVLGGALHSLRAWRLASPVDAGDARIHEGFARLRQAPFVLYFPAVLAVIAFGNLRFSTYVGPVEVGSYRYLVPHFMYAAMVIGAALAAALGSQGALRRALGKLLALAVVLCIPFALPLYPETRVASGAGASYRGYWMPFYSGVALHHQRFDTATGRYTWDLDEVLGIIREFPPHDREEILFGIGLHIAMALDQSAGYPGAPRLEDLVAGFPEPDGTSLARGMGCFVGQRLHGRGRRRERATAHLAEIVATEHPLRPHVLEGLSLPNTFPLTCTVPTRFERARSLGRHLPEELRAPWMVGRGIAFGRLAARLQPADDAPLKAELDELRGSGPRTFWEGVGRGVATQAGLESAADVLERWVPAAHRSTALGGFGDELRRYRPALEPEGWAARHLEDEALREAFLQGWEG